jgi:sigma-B regulation protein RsbU (phosphoserine phosphatase)
MLLVRNGKAISIEENGLVLAAFDFASYSDPEYPLQDGDRFVLYTDGLLEASDATGNSFGQARLRAKAGQSSGLAPSDRADTLLSAARNWSTSQMDDLTLIVCDCSL